jgi:AcrR family transcriptional regulator
MSASTRRRSPRKDAVANRTRVLAAAAEVFRREGFGAGVEKIAREAGTNVSTLYRNFPSKSALQLAIGESLMHPLAAARDEALATDAPDAVGRFLRAQVAVHRDNRGLVDALGMPELDPDVRRRLLALAADVAAPVAERGHQDGSLAPALDVHDLLIAVRMVHGAIVSADDRARDPQPYVDIVARGLRSSATPGGPHGRS